MASLHARTHTHVVSRTGVYDVQTVYWLSGFIEEVVVCWQHWWTDMADM